MAHKDVANIVAAINGIVDMGLFPGQAEHHLDLEAPQHLDDRFSSV